MSPWRPSREAEVDPFYDMLFNMLIAFVFCFIIALLAINPRALKTGDVPSKAEYLITLSWPDLDPNDIDLWVRGPSGDVVWYRAREAGLMYLDRDDRGAANNTLTVDGRQIVNPLRQEVVTVRGVVPGEYVVNANYYDGGKSQAPAPPAMSEAVRARLGQPVDVTLSVLKVNPRAAVVYYGQGTLAHPGQEITLARFHIQPDGGVTDIDTLPVSLVRSL